MLYLNLIDILVKDIQQYAIMAEKKEISDGHILKMHCKCAFITEISSTMMSFNVYEVFDCS